MSARIARLELFGISDAARTKFDLFRDSDFTVSFGEDGVQLHKRDYDPELWGYTITIKARKVRIVQLWSGKYACKFLYKLARLHFSDVRVDALGALIPKELAMVVRNFLD